MGTKEIISYFKRGKMIQLAIVIVIAVSFVVILATNADLRTVLFTNKSVSLLCVFIWLLLLIALINIFLDFYKLNSFNSVADQNEIKNFMQQSGGMLNRFSADNLFKSDEVEQVLEKVGCSMIEIANLKETNQKAGRDAGDKMIDDFCEMLENVGNDYGIVVRNGGNEFLIVIADCTEEIMRQCLTELTNSIAVYNQEESPNPIEIHTTYVLNSDEHLTRFSEVLTKAYHQLHKSTTEV
ncbi:MAG: diguanylate cyclase [Lachnospiraceae bacterium]|nr:diguanylate cyclase [Lachnospiraceae bacterium]